MHFKIVYLIGVEQLWKNLYQYLTNDDALCIQSEIQIASNTDLDTKVDEAKPANDDDTKTRTVTLTFRVNNYTALYLDYSDYSHYDSRDDIMCGFEFDQQEW